MAASPILPQGGGTSASSSLQEPTKVTERERGTELESLTAVTEHVESSGTAPLGDSSYAQSVSGGEREGWTHAVYHLPVALSGTTTLER